MYYRATNETHDNGGHFFNGDTGNVFNLQCTLTPKLNAACEVICQPNFIPSSHHGNVAACGRDGPSNSMQWVPGGLSRQNVCVPDILMATPGLQRSLRAEFSTSTSFSDFSGYKKHARMVESNFDVPTKLVSTPSTAGITLTDIGGEFMHIQNSASRYYTASTLLIKTTFFAVIIPGALADYQKITSFFNLPFIGLGNAAAPAHCKPVDTLPHLVTIVAYVKDNKQYVGLRVDGRMCTGGTATPTKSMEMLDAQSWHLFERNKPSSMALGVLWGSASPTFAGKFSEIALYLNADHDVEACTSERDTNCPRHKLEAIEFLLMKRHGIMAAMDKGQCPKQCTGNTCTTYCSEGLF
jgi:hypothetical protein